MHVSGQIIAKSHDLTPNGGLVREIPLFQGNPGWWNIIVCPDVCQHLPGIQQGRFNSLFTTKFFGESALFPHQRHLDMLDQTFLTWRYLKMSRTWCSHVFQSTSNCSNRNTTRCFQRFLASLYQDFSGSCDPKKKTPFQRPSVCASHPVKLDETWRGMVVCVCIKTIIHCASFLYRCKHMIYIYIIYYIYSIYMYIKQMHFVMNLLISLCHRDDPRKSSNSCNLFEKKACSTTRFLDFHLLSLRFCPEKIILDKAKVLESSFQAANSLICPLDGFDPLKIWCGWISLIYLHAFCVGKTADLLVYASIGAHVIDTYMIDTSVN